ncbi:two-partner secretion domain-containing protein [Coleofasciculus sp. E1-EBD-02]|uniref:two-partner secretion domain-containing protein n=1 Tax=Coleofasciculus sp. E1-EBD-02 TaxID=3068481 RepID=UPI004062C485
MNPVNLIAIAIAVRTHHFVETLHATSLQLKSLNSRQALKWFCYFGLVSSQIFYAAKINAQLVPDDTLGAENSIVVPQEARDLIQGGARRGSNLFHSFQEFNVDPGQQVYFANPTDVDHILTRVTGTNLSNIFGTLGVEGAASLYLINPNGIIFGQDARLDVTGSFVASTADGIRLGEQGLFLATEPEKSTLLSIQPGVFFFNYLTGESATITNAGNLSVGGNLTLAANTLNLQGQLIAGENLTLHANHTVNIRDSLVNPFIAKAGGNMQVQGDRTIDIFALNHPDSGVFANGDMVFRSANPVQGDAHFWSGGEFRIEQLDGNLGTLRSPNDPVIRSRGDVLMGAYQGASLHIFAGGSVTIPGGVLIDNVDAENGIVETITLSDGTSILIDGKTQPTLDIRAGTTAFGIPGVNGIPSNGIIVPPFPNLLESPTRATISIGNIVNPGGTVFLTNQYQPNPSLAGGITVGSMNTQGMIAGGTIIIDSKGLIDTTSGTIDTSSLGEAGDILLQAVGDIGVSDINTNGQIGGRISLNSGATLTIDNSIITSVTRLGKGGDIELFAPSLVLSGGSKIFSVTVGSGQGGNIQINADSIRADDNSDINTISASLNDNADINNIIEILGSPTGDIADLIQFLPANNTLGSISGSGGNIQVSAESITLADESNIATATFANGGQAGNVRINGTSVNLLDDGTVGSLTYGAGDAGHLTLNSRQLLIQNNKIKSEVGTGISTAARTNSSGDAGDLIINAESIEIIGNEPGAAVAPTDLNTLLELAKLRTGLTSATQGSGDAGNVTINSDRLVVRDGAGIATSADFTSTGTAGTLRVNATQIELQGKGGITTLTLGSGDTRAGNLYINAERVTLLDGAGIGTGTLSGNGGNIILTATDLLLMQNNSLITTTAGQAGAGGDGGDINIDAKFIVAVLDENSDIAANAFEGNGGNIDITTQGIFGLQVSDKLTPNNDITASSQLGIDGRITINTPNVDPSRGLTELPFNFTDPSNQIIAGCPADTGNRFTAIGRGGIPDNPRDYLPGNAVWQDRRNVAAFPDNQPTVTLPSETPEKQIIEAQGWIVNEEGTVILTAESSGGNRGDFGGVSSSCGGINDLD